MASLDRCVCPAAALVDILVRRSCTLLTTCLAPDRLSPASATDCWRAVSSEYINDIELQGSSRGITCPCVTPIVLNMPPACAGQDLQYGKGGTLGLAPTWPQAAGVLPQAADTFDWEGDRPLNRPLHDLVVYEMHVRGFTQHSSSGVEAPGRGALQACLSPMWQPPLETLRAPEQMHNVYWGVHPIAPASMLHGAWPCARKM